MRALIAFLLLVAPTFAGPPTKYPEQIKSSPPPSYLVRVFSFNQEAGTRSSGTGTLIRPDTVVTASHVVDGKEGASVEIMFYTTWEVVIGKVVKVSPNNDTDGRDVAIIKLDNPRPENVLELAPKALMGSIEIQGYSHGPYTKQIGTYYTTERTKRWGIIRGAQARNGDSGGPVVQQGKLAGVLWGSIQDHTWFTPVEFLYELYPDLKTTTAKVEEPKPDAPVEPIRYSL